MSRDGVRPALAQLRSGTLIFDIGLSHGNFHLVAVEPLTGHGLHDLFWFDPKPHGNPIAITLSSESDAGSWHCK